MRHSLDVIHCARQDYASGDLSVADICRKHGIGRQDLYYWLDGGPPNGEHHLPPHSAAPAASAAPDGDDG